MSRIGNKPITLPANVKLTISAEGAVRAEGPKGKLDWSIPEGISGVIKDGHVLSLIHI